MISSEYIYPTRYNKYLLTMCGELDLNHGNLLSMLEYGRYYGEIIRDVDEYIRYLKTISSELECIPYENFIRNEKISYLLDD